MYRHTLYGYQNPRSRHNVYMGQGGFLQNLKLPVIQYEMSPRDRQMIQGVTVTLAVAAIATALIATRK